MLDLANMLLVDDGIPQNKDESDRHYQSSIDKGDDKAIFE